MFLTTDSAKSDSRRRYVFITGTSTGIGRACAIRLARTGYAVLASVRTEADAKSIEEAGVGTALGIRSIRLELTDPNSVETAAAQIRECVGGFGLCALVNNAGICVVGPCESVTIDQWRHQFEVNVFGAIATTQALLPLLRLHNSVYGSGSARVINISSITGEIATPLFGAYSASKFALGAFSDALRLELRAEGIEVSTIVPGTIQSEIWRKEREQVEALGSDSPARKTYGELIDNVSEYVFKCADTAIPADRVANVLDRCLASQSPHPRYLIGWEAQTGSRARKLIPDRFFGYLLAKTLHVPAAHDPQPKNAVAEISD